MVMLTVIFPVLPYDCDPFLLSLRGVPQGLPPHVIARKDAVLLRQSLFYRPFGTANQCDQGTGDCHGPFPWPSQWQIRALCALVMTDHRDSRGMCNDLPPHVIARKDAVLTKQSLFSVLLELPINVTKGPEIATGTTCPRNDRLHRPYGTANRLGPWDRRLPRRVVPRNDRYGHCVPSQWQKNLH